MYKRVNQVYGDDIVKVNYFNNINNYKNVSLFEVTRAYTEKDLPITSSDALPLSYRRLVGAKAIKLGSWDKHPAYC